MTLVACGDCQHFIRNPHNPAAGAGSCAVNAYWQCGSDYPPKRPVPMYPPALRTCRSFRPCQ